ncbi:trypsin-like peptidase domain-containing protein [Dehalobacter sp. DCM]|uniref:S1C family serine protease n=1 Tax=Dehalobacter sp. DCM TaxID=2907827 RepID=UPI0030820D28|nr:trypsin-like peptidase domain-containing protein [Dehalobacter sp. DCM]
MILAVVSAVLGGLITVTLVPALYPNSNIVSGGKVIIEQGAPPPVDSAGSSSGISPVVTIAKTVGPAVVGIANFQYSSDFFGGSTGLSEAGSGSGFIINSTKGYIVTNYHVVENAEKLMVSLVDGRDVPGTLVGGDERTDLAVIKIEDTQNLTAVQLGDSSLLQVGESVVAIGNPGGQEFARTVTNGVVSATDRFLLLQGEASFNLIQTDAAINPGNSGGPLVNYSGQVIGINSAKNNTQGFEGMGFAIPISDALPFIQQIIEKGYASHPGLQVGIDDRYTEEYATYKNWPMGCYIASVQNGGSADRAGIRAGDIVTAINGIDISNSLELTHQLFKYKVGDRVTVSYFRGGNTYTAEVVLGEIK